MAKGCRVCGHIERSSIERALAFGQTPRSLAGEYKNLSRRQIQRHLTECLEGYPKIAVALSIGMVTVEEVAADLAQIPGYSPATVEKAMSVVRRLAELEAR